MISGCINKIQPAIVNRDVEDLVVEDVSADLFQELPGKPQKRGPLVVVECPEAY